MGAPPGTYPSSIEQKKTDNQSRNDCNLGHKLSLMACSRVANGWNETVYKGYNVAGVACQWSQQCVYMTSPLQFGAGLAFISKSSSMERLLDTIKRNMGQRTGMVYRNGKAKTSSCKLNARCRRQLTFTKVVLCLSAYSAWQ